MQFEQDPRFEEQGGLNPYQTPMDTMGSTILQMTDPEDVVENMTMSFRGLAIVNDKLTKVGEPLMNEEGINRVKSLVQSITNRNSVMSNMKRNFIEHQMLYFCETLRKSLMVNRGRYGIYDWSARDDIVEIASNYVYMTLRRASEEGERRFLKGSMHEVKQTIDSPRQGMFSGWGKKNYR